MILNDGRVKRFDEIVDCRFGVGVSFYAFFKNFSVLNNHISLYSNHKYNTMIRKNKIDRKKHTAFEIFGTCGTVSQQLRKQDCVSAGDYQSGRPVMFRRIYNLSERSIGFSIRLILSFGLQIRPDEPPLLQRKNHSP